MSSTRRVLTEKSISWMNTRERNTDFQPQLYHHYIYIVMNTPPPQTCCTVALAWRLLLCLITFHWLVVNGKWTKSMYGVLSPYKDRVTKICIPAYSVRFIGSTCACLCVCVHYQCCPLTYFSTTHILEKIGDELLWLQFTVVIKLACWK